MLFEQAQPIPLEPDLNTDQVISTEFSDFTRQIIGLDNTLTIYLHFNGEPILVNGGSFGSQVISPLPLDPGLVGHIQALISRFDTSLLINFEFVASPQDADISFYLDSDIRMDQSSTATLGLAVSNVVDGRPSWEIFVNGSALSANRNYLYYAVSHEFCHVLGLEHPFDGADGDFYKSQNYWESAYPEQTVLAYRSPRSGQWPIFPSNIDIAALQILWGADSAPIPSGYDVLSGSLEVDILRGNRGSHIYRSPADGLTDWILVQPDAQKKRSKSQSSFKTIDLIDEVGSEDRIVLLGVKKRDLAIRAVFLDRSPFGQLQGSGIFVDGRLEVICKDPTISNTTLARMVGAGPVGFQPPV